MYGDLLGGASHPQMPSKQVTIDWTQIRAAPQYVPLTIQKERNYLIFADTLRVFWAIAITDESMLVAIELQQSHSWRAHPQISVAILDHAHYTGQCIRRRLLPIESVLRQYVRRPVIDREALAGRVVDPKLPESILKKSNLNPIS